MDVAIKVSEWSKDDRKVGSVIVRSKKILSTGFNGVPRKLNDNLSRYEKPMKYLYVEHAERNAIYNQHCDISSSTIYSTLFPCVDCARAIIQSDIIQVVSFKPDFNHHKWGDQFKLALNMFMEAGIDVVYIDD